MANIDIHNLTKFYSTKGEKISLDRVRKLLNLIIKLKQGSNCFNNYNEMIVKLEKIYNKHINKMLLTLV